MITYEDLFIEINNKLYIHKNIYMYIYKWNKYIERKI